MDSLSISSYRNLEQLTLRQNAAFTKNVANNSYISGLTDEPASTKPTSTLSEEPVPQTTDIINELVQVGQKLNLLA